MTRNERFFLKNAIKYVIHFDKDSWMDLKREIFDRGYQGYYESQGDFVKPTEIALKKLSAEEREGLLKEYRNIYNDYTKDDDYIIYTHYFLVIIAEVIRRATIASMRTINWDGWL